ncbi:hypothetical protein PPL_12284 [Heterostelium album PN500]|uniref:Uncharacterized protein n=1 Tax=Heterostelium pallidum (strain ATCC 26659 / Pp 5 / PN500) TaxID=670386 RepID=D3BM75_HETP5|nr:hypothetical protein PPL_12284 [Heterostelium album PN500]EFA77676.1 hypothetical protein PPL_12284 [Heterostelium album PN500]|eukprot:XP_020429804.1 hypothetical protein PPL_12284 [Heterostelium album PN500]
MPLTNSSPSIMQTPPQPNSYFFSPPDLNQQFVSNLQSHMYSTQSIPTGFSNSLIYDNSQPNFMSPSDTYSVENYFGNINNVQTQNNNNSNNNHGAMDSFSSPAPPQQSPVQQVPQQHQPAPQQQQAPTFQHTMTPPVSFSNNTNLYSSIKTMTTPPSQHSSTSISIQPQFIPPSLYNSYHSQSSPNLSTFHQKLPSNHINSQQNNISQQSNQSHNIQQSQQSNNSSAPGNKINTITINKSSSTLNLQGNSVGNSISSNQVNFNFPQLHTSTAQTPPSPISSPSPHCSSNSSTPISLSTASLTSSTPPSKEEDNQNEGEVTLKEKEDVARTAYKTWFVLKPGNKEVKDRWWALYYNKVLPKYHLRDNHLGRKINQWIEEDMRELEKQGLVPAKMNDDPVGGEGGDTKKRKPNSTKEGSLPAYINVLLINPSEEKNNLTGYCGGNSINWNETDLETLVGLFKDNRQRIMDNVNSGKKKSLPSPSSPSTPSFTNTSAQSKKAAQHKDKKLKAKTNETPQPQIQPLVRLEINCDWIFAETDDVCKYVISGEKKKDSSLSEVSVLSGKRKYGSFQIEAILPLNADYSLSSVPYEHKINESCTAKSDIDKSNNPQPHCIHKLIESIKLPNGVLSKILPSSNNRHLSQVVTAFDSKSNPFGGAGSNPAGVE